MNTFYSEVLQLLEEEINDLNIQTDNPISLSEGAVSLIIEKLKQVKAFILNKEFSSKSEEIFFFK